MRTYANGFYFGPNRKLSTMPTTITGNASTSNKLMERITEVEENSRKSSSRFRRKIGTATSQEKSKILLFEPTSPDEFCKQLLINGYVQSYIDFYYLAQSNNVFGNDAKNHVYSIDDLKEVRNNLVQAEVSRRQGNTSGVFAAYKALAMFYFNRRDWSTSIFFYEKFLEISQITMDIRSEMVANHELGLVLFKMNDFDGSLKRHLRHEELALSVDLVDEIAKSNAQLHKVYVVIASKYERELDLESALKFYQLSLEAAKKCWDKGAEAEANGNIGNILLQNGKAEESLSYLVQQSNITADMGFAEGRCRASSALALAYDQLGKSDKALTELTLVHDISEQDGDILLQSKASKELGALYSKLGRLQDAVDSLERHFLLLNNIKSTSKAIDAAHGPTPTDFDVARSFVGISRGNLLLGAYVVRIESDLQGLLSWKLSREPVQ